MFSCVPWIGLRNHCTPRHSSCRLPLNESSACCAKVEKLSLRSINDTSDYTSSNADRTPVSSRDDADQRLALNDSSFFAAARSASYATAGLDRPLPFFWLRIDAGRIEKEQDD